MEQAGRTHPSKCWITHSSGEVKKSEAWRWSTLGTGSFYQTLIMSLVLDKI